MELFICFLLFSSFIDARPTFPKIENIFYGSPIPDADGIYRHNSETIKRENSNLDSENVNYKYEAKLIDGVIRLDEDENIDEIKCGSNELAVNALDSTFLSEWKIGNTLVGGKEWNCFGNHDSNGFVAEIISIKQREENSWIFGVKYKKMEDLFQHLDFEFRFVPDDFGTETELPLSNVQNAK